MHFYPFRDIYCAINQNFLWQEFLKPSQEKQRRRCARMKRSTVGDSFSPLFLCAFKSSWMLFSFSLNCFNEHMEHETLVEGKVKGNKNLRNGKTLFIIKENLFHSFLLHYDSLWLFIMKMEMNVFSMPRLHETFCFDDERFLGRVEEFWHAN